MDAAAIITAISSPDNAAKELTAKTEPPPVSGIVAQVAIMTAITTPLTFVTAFAFLFYLPTLLQ